CTTPCGRAPAPTATASRRPPVRTSPTRCGRRPTSCPPSWPPRRGRSASTGASSRCWATCSAASVGRTSSTGGSSRACSTASPRWGVRQTLPRGGVVATGVAQLPDGVVPALALGLLALFSRGAPGEVHHNPLAALAFAPLTLAGLLVGRGLVGGAPPRRLIGRATAVAVTGLGWTVVAQLAGVPFNKTVGTSSFVAVATAASAALLLATAGL